MRFPLNFVPVQSWHNAPLKFGSNRSGGKRKHAGCDLYAPIGTPVFAVADGTVKGFAAFYLGTFALTVDHGEFWIRYGEISTKIASGLKVGDKVKEGDKIGEVGDLEGLDLAMVHLEMYRGNVTGPLTVPANTPFMRRSDLIDPTSRLDEWAGQLTGASPAPPAGSPKPALAAQPVLRRGSTGDDVLAWQKRLLAQGFAMSLDSAFGETTETATKQFQQDAGLQDDGIVGRDTYDAMVEAEKD